MGVGVIESRNLLPSTTGLYEAVSDDHAAAKVAASIAAGIRFFDTAPLYGHGLAESRLGRALDAIPRDQIVVATKVGRLLREVSYTDAIRFYYGTPDVNPIFDFSEQGVLRSIAESLDRLWLDRMDVLHIHDPDEHHDEALNGAFRALERLRDEGVIGAIGAGMNQSAMLDLPSTCSCSHVSCRPKSSPYAPCRRSTSCSTTSQSHRSGKGGAWPRCKVGLPDCAP